MAATPKDSEPRGDWWWSFKTAASVFFIVTAALAPFIYTLESGQRPLLGLLGSGIVVATAISLPRMIKLEEPTKELNRRLNS